MLAEINDKTTNLQKMELKVNAMENNIDIILKDISLEKDLALKKFEEAGSVLQVAKKQLIVILVLIYNKFSVLD